MPVRDTVGGWAHNNNVHYLAVVCGVAQKRPKWQSTHDTPQERTGELLVMRKKSTQCKVQQAAAGTGTGAGAGAGSGARDASTCGSLGGPSPAKSSTYIQECFSKDRAETVGRGRRAYQGPGCRPRGQKSALGHLKTPFGTVNLMLPKLTSLPPKVVLGQGAHAQWSSARLPTAITAAN